jgi:hypothetical protein
VGGISEPNNSDQNALERDRHGDVVAVNSLRGLTPRLRRDRSLACVFALGLGLVLTLPSRDTDTAYVSRCPLLVVSEHDGPHG